MNAARPTPRAVHAVDEPANLPWYRPVGEELAVFAHCADQKLPLLLKGPTGCGKSRFVEYMAAKLGRPLITVACHDDTSATDLLGRWLIEAGQTVWLDGPVTRAVRQGAILYLDEIAEARPDVVVTLHPLTDHRRELFVERRNESLPAPENFMLVASFNPGYAQGFKGLKPSTRQRFVSLSFTYPATDVEIEILRGETGIDERRARQLVLLGQKFRGLEELGLAHGASTRLLVDAAKLMRAGLAPRLACRVALAEPLTDEAELLRALCELVDLAF